MNISVVGTGYVGLVTGACLADLGNAVLCVDADRRKIATLKRGRIPIYEPGLEELVKKNVREKRLTFGTSIADAVRRSQIIFIAVGTPSRPDGSADLQYVEAVAKEVAACLDGYRVVVEKSTVPVETGQWIEQTIRVHNARKQPFDVVSNPEFLREGSAVRDFLHPDRVVIGVSSKRAEKLMLQLYRPLGAPIVVTDVKSAELTKHAANSFLALKISYINAISFLCEKVGADVKKVAEGMGLDRRIGPSFLDAGAGFGGSCFPKDLAAFIHIAGRLGSEFDLLKAVERINEQARHHIVEKVEKAVWTLTGKTVAVLGLAFKPDTDDLRSAPAMEVIATLQKEGARIRVYDPVAMPKARESLKGVRFCRDAYDAARGSDCVVVMTEWNEFKEIDLERLKKVMRAPVLVDGRNIYEPGRMRELGFRYYGVGRVA